VCEVIDLWHPAEGIGLAQQLTIDRNLAADSGMKLHDERTVV